jgi:hypothetical protein
MASAVPDVRAECHLRIRRYVLYSYGVLIVWLVLIVGAIVLFAFDDTGHHSGQLTDVVWCLGGFGAFPLLTHLLARVTERRSPKLAGYVALAPAVLVGAGILCFLVAIALQFMSS